MSLSRHARVEWQRKTTANVRGDSTSGMGALARHLIHDHGYLTLAYLAGHADSPDNIARRQALAEAAASAGVTFVDGPQWQGNYLASGGGEGDEATAGREGSALPRAIVCANDQTALGVMYELARHGIDVPGEVAVTGFDDIPVARHLRPQLTTIRQPIHDLGATAFEVLRSMIGNGTPAERDIRPANPAGPPGKLQLPEPAARSSPGPRQLDEFWRRPVMRLIARRLVLYLLTAIVAITVNFFIPRLMPGNPVEVAIGHIEGQVTPATIHALDLQYGLNTKLSLLAQYFHYLNQLVHGNLGISFSSYPATVTSVIRSALPWTLGLVGLATILSFVVGTLLGIVAAWRRGSWLDNLLPAMTFFQAAPYFFVAILIVAVFATKLGWFPQNSGYDTTTLNPGLNLPFLSSLLDHAVLPALTIVVGSIAGWIIGMRNMMLTTMDEDYVLIAAAKGLSNRKVVGYAARNAILPSVSGFSLAIGFVVSGSLLTEIVFSYPGLGYILLQAIGGEDYRCYSRAFS